MKRKAVLAVMITALLMLAGCSDKRPIPSSNPVVSVSSTPDLQMAEPIPESQSELKIHFIDVGQADAIFIQTPQGESILIDGGSNEDEQAICAYLKSQNVKTIKVLLGTHPHEDHIGGLDAVIKNFPVESVYLPRVTHNTETFKDLLQAIKDRELKIKTARAGVIIPLADLGCTIIAPNADQQYDSLNDYSAVLKLDYDQQSFLFCGDAGKAIEYEMLAADCNLQSNVIKIGHHGSYSSSSTSFLKRVSPEYAVISCGKDNPYGHPHSETLSRLKAAGIKILRTDQLGTIVMTADGNNKIDFNVNTKG